MKKLFTIIIFWFIGPLFFLFAQTFTKITDPSNPVVSIPTDGNYSGAAWIDYDNDGDIDLYTTKTFLFKNDGNGNFTLINTIIGENFNNNTGNGATWGDYDNDGLIDIFLAGVPSALYKNIGNDSFELITEGDLELDKRGWASAWGDYNNDSFLDLMITHPSGFIPGTPTPSHFFYNNGDGRFTKLFNYEFTQLFKAYTVGTWSDYDLDGDIDLFIGSGPAGTPAVDNLYRNTFTETGTADLIRIDTNPIATDLQDGQVWNWIDYDNDGDLDAYVTNYGGAINRFYKNNNGSYTSINNELVFGGQCLANAWGDFDNDGLADVVITSESANFFFKNNGDDSFTAVNNSITQNPVSRSVSIGDYNNDGLLDIFLTGNGQGKGLFLNETQNSNNWINITLKGTVSNFSAIGTKVKAKATINGNAVWQIREVSAQNSFDGQNSLRVHFGLGDASSVDSLIIDWPSGYQQVYTNVTANQFYNYTEEIPAGFIRANFTADKITALETDPEINFTDLSLSDPNLPLSSWEWDFNNDGITDATEQNPSFIFPGSGKYTVKLTVSNGSTTNSKTRSEYINIKKFPGVPQLIYSLPVSPDTIIPKNGTVNFIASAIDTTGYELSYNWFKNSQQVGNDTSYKYISSQFLPERTDTIKVSISNSYNTTERVWLVHVMESTGINTEEDLPADFSLDQNYPNPFNPETKITFSLPAAEFVKLNIYDLLGNKITTIVDEYKPAGFYEVFFNSSKYFLPSGLYFYNIKAGSFSSTKKMLLLK